MTLQNGAIHGGNAYLWSDTAWFEPATGKMVGKSPKAFHGLRWPWSVSTSLVGADTSSFSGIVAQVGKHDPADIPALLDACTAALRTFALASESRTGRLMVAAWDKGLNTARLFFITSDVVVGPAFEPAEALHLVSGGTGSDAYRRFVESGNQPKHMQGLITVQRKERWTVPGFALGHYVGGEVVRHAVTADGVKHVVACQWHDRIGHRIKA